jgi:hypothetical protein
MRNLFGADLVGDVAVPVVAGTVGFVLARYAGNMASEKIPQLADPRYGKLAAAAVLIPATFAAARMYPGTVRRNSGAVVLGVGLAAAESFLRNTPLLGGAPAAAVITASAPSAPSAPAAPASTGSYYTDGMLSGLGRGYDLSHAGAPYQGMLGIEYATAGFGEYVSQPMNGGDGLEGLGGLGEPGDQGAVDGSMNRMEAVSTITPTDLALKTPMRPAVAPVDVPFASGDKGYAGGVFARHLFSGMLT